MTNLQQFLRRRIWMIPLAVAAAFMLTSTSAHAQYADQSQCTSGLIVYEDGSDAIGQTVCLSYDSQSGLDSYVETDNDYAGDFYAEYGDYDLFTYGVAAEAQLVGNNSYIVADTGMIYSATDFSGGQSAYAIINNTPQQYSIYQLNGYYQECEGNSPDDCSWESDSIWGSVNGLSVELNLAPPLLTPTLSATTSGTPSMYGQPITFTATVTSGATGTVAFNICCDAVSGYYVLNPDGTIPAGPIDGTTSTATYTTGTLPPATYSVTANYYGDSNYYAASSNAINQVVVNTPGRIAYTPPPPGTTDYSYTITPTGGPSGYAPNGNLLSYTDWVNGTWSFGTSGYDSLNRLVGGSSGSGPFQGLQMSWSYDSFGNRTSENLGGISSTTAQYNANNQVTGGSIGYDPTGSGNVTYDNANQYLYDGEERICAVRDLTFGGMTEYIYDAEGTRVAKGTISAWTCDTTANGFNPTYLYVIGPSGEQLTETDGQGNWLHTNVFAAGQLLATYSYTDSSQTTTDTYFALSDWLGTKRAVVSAGGCGTGYVSLPYGDSLTPTNLPGFTQCPDATEHHFTGKERDTESGNDYFGARYYASSMGRFLSPDWSAQAEPVPYAKLDNPQSLNLYSYMYNSPLGGVDADGHWPGWLDNGVADTRQWAAEHPRTMEAAAAVATGVATVGAVALIVATAPVSVPATLGAAAITALTTTTAVIGATGGAVATVTLAAGAISGDVKGTSAAATAVGTVTNPVGMAVALGTGGNMQAAGTAATATSLVTGLQSAATGANALIQAGGAASAASAASGLAPAPTPAPARTPAPTPCSTDTSQCH
jgi:RHS repeat-associated protein